MQFTCELSSFNGPVELQRSSAAMRRLLDFLQGVDADYLRAHPEAPWLYASGIRWREEAPGQPQEVLDVPHCLLRRGPYGGVDCLNLSCWRAAELEVRRGVPAVAVGRVATVRPDGSYLWHVDVRTPEGMLLEDPSRLRGMR